MSKQQILTAIQYPVNFRDIEVWVPAVGEFVRADREEFIKLIKAAPDHRQYKAEIVGFTVRIG